MILVTSIYPFFDFSNQCSKREGLRVSLFLVFREIRNDLVDNLETRDLMFERRGHIFIDERAVL